MGASDYTRRDFLKTVGLGAASLVVPGCTSAAKEFTTKAHKVSSCFLLTTRALTTWAATATM
ncbi:MAG: twin-arginine translocation signal domain-containing protein [Planctomycetota bacterium]